MKVLDNTISPPPHDAPRVGAHPSRLWGAALAVIALVAAGAGLLAGLLPSVAEPDGVYLECGPALFGRPSPRPAGCDSAYAPFDSIAIGLLVVAALALLAAVTVIVRSRRPSNDGSRSPA